MGVSEKRVLRGSKYAYIYICIHIYREGETEREYKGSVAVPIMDCIQIVLRNLHVPCETLLRMVGP